MKKIIIALLIILSVFMICSCDPTTEDKKPPLGYGINDEKQFLRLTDGGKDTLTVFHLLQMIDDDNPEFHMEKPLEDYHDYTSIFEEFEWAVEHAPCKTPPKKIPEENYIMIVGYADNGEYEAFIFCKNEATGEIGEAIADGEFFSTRFHFNDTTSTHLYKNCSRGPKFQLFESRMAKYN